MTIVGGREGREMDDDGRMMFRQVRTGRISERIVERLKDAIRRGQLSVGERLPSERQLTEQLNVSRVTVRDALRILQARGSSRSGSAPRAARSSRPPRRDSSARGSPTCSRCPI
jgi:DNA-binding FadR family transcriptional regulator